MQLPPCQFMVLFLLGISTGMFIMSIRHKLTHFCIFGFYMKLELGDADVLSRFLLYTELLACFC